MGLIDDDEIPRRGVNVRRFAPRELVGADDDRSVEVERPEVTALDGLIVRLRFQDGARKEELLAQFLVPLLPQVGRRDNQNPALSLRPALRDDKAGLDRLSKPDLIGQQRALG